MVIFQKRQKKVRTVKAVLVSLICCCLAVSPALVKATVVNLGVDWTSMPLTWDGGINFGTDVGLAVAYGGGKYVAVGKNGKASYSTDGITWTALTAGTSTGIKFGISYAYSVTYADGKFVVVGEAGKAAYSVDGINWTALTPGAGSGIKFGTSTAYSVFYGGSKFIAVGEAGKASYSTDGIDWTVLPAGDETGIAFGTYTAYALTYGGGKYVIVGESGKASYSTNGVSWFPLTAGEETGIKFLANDAYAVVYGGNKFVVAGENGYASYSADGETWTTLPAGSGTGIKFGTTSAWSLGYGYERFVVVGDSGMASYSTDGISWTALTPGEDTGIMLGTNSAWGVKYCDDKFIAVADGGYASYSTDGVTWISLPPYRDTGIKFGTYSVYSAAYGSDKFVAVGGGGKASYSTDGISWVSLPRGASTGIKFGSTTATSVAYGGGKFVVVGYGGKASYSTNGTSWTALTPGEDTGIKFGTDYAYSVAYGGGKFVVVGENGRASYSLDGISWEKLPAGAGTGLKFGTENAYTIAYGGNKFVAAGDSGMASYSSDGINWTVLPAGEATGIKFGTYYAWSITYGADKFVVVGEYGLASYSSDGITWTALPAGDETGIKFGSTYARGVAYGGGKYVVVGESGYGSYSTDGMSWTRLPAGLSTGIKFGEVYAWGIAFGDSTFVTVGDSGLVSYSTTANTAPFISVGPYNSTASNNPIKIGGAVKFRATATDAQSDNFYLAICKTDNISANDLAAPSCNDGGWCTSEATNAGTEASCNYTARSDDATINDWYAFVCDNNADSKCSLSETSKFYVNSMPLISSIANIAQKTDGAGSISLKVIVSDADRQKTEMLLEYSADNKKWNKAKILGVTASKGSAVIDNTKDRQITSIDTDEGETTVTIDWDALSDLGAMELKSVYLRASAYDALDTGDSLTSDKFSYDGLAPLISDLKIAADTLSSVYLEWLAPKTESNFRGYTICLGLTKAAAEKCGDVWNNATNPDLAKMATNRQQITGLIPETDYFFILSAADKFGNKNALNVDGQTMMPFVVAVAPQSTAEPVRSPEVTPVPTPSPSISDNSSAHGAVKALSTEISVKNIKKAVETVSQTQSAQVLNYAATAVSVVTVGNTVSVAAGSMNIFEGVPHLLQWLFHFFTGSFTLLRRRRRWGRVVNYYSGAPVGKAVVLIIDTVSGKVKMQETADKDGYFSSLIPAGTYTFQVQKSGWELTTEKLPFQLGPDERYYNGEPVNVVEENIIPVVLALKPLEVRVSKLKGYFLMCSNFLETKMTILSWVLIGAGLVFNIGVYFSTKSLASLLVFGIYVIVIGIKIILNRKYKKTLGVICDKNTEQGLGLAIIRLYDLLSNRLVATKATAASGQFMLLARPGQYKMTVLKEGYQPYDVPRITILNGTEALALKIKMEPVGI